MKRLTAISVALALVAIAIRVRNALRYPADWGFDATFNWRYIYRLTQDWALPPLRGGLVDLRSSAVLLRVGRSRCGA